MTDQNPNILPDGPDEAERPRAAAPGEDLTGLLRAWPYEAGRVNVRMLRAADGRTILQMRLELGVLQMELTGRPDGLRPEGRESLLEHHLARRDLWAKVHGDARGFVLGAEECAALREEAVQYYHRYVGLLVLEEYDGVIRDTTRNLEVFDLCRDHGAEEGDRSSLEQFRPYVVMMRSRAEAARAVGAGDPRGALEAIDRGLAEIRMAMEDIGTADRFDDANEVQLLRGMREMLVPRLPVSQRAELHERLRAAVAAENYELAAILRDELRLLEG
ncbi:MAG TPA: UvrB/UvrC motif-containing protein [Phycisphaerales bacterium]|nr:UvrB/UvrC motif-containing protein [Phycisphaerales bacterium]HMP35994.1 UvrB/UvrC motif-containing protein [Phycisphaerales bacterium]